MNARSFLFLDFDGVLHPVGCEVDDLFSRLDMLQDWLRNRPGIDVVISSSWRGPHPLHELRHFFDEDLQRRIIGVTPRCVRSEPPQCQYERHAEVLQWLAQSDCPRRRWAAIDDMPELFEPGALQVVLCDPTVGVTLRELKQLDTLLGVSAEDTRDLYIVPDDLEEQMESGRRLWRERLAGDDMISVSDAAEVTSRSIGDIEVAVARGTCLGARDEAGVLRLPRWQFEPSFTGIVQRVSKALRTTDGLVLLNAFETPHGALGSVTLRAAIERGQAERALEVIGYD